MKYNLKDFTLEEKLNLLSDKTSWTNCDLNGKVRSLFLADGPHGLRKRVNSQTVPATSMPNLSQIANSWDRESAYLDGQTIAMVGASSQNIRLCQKIKIELPETEQASSDYVATDDKNLQFGFEKV